MATQVVSTKILSLSCETFKNTKPVQYIRPRVLPGLFYTLVRSMYDSMILLKTDMAGTGRKYFKILSDICAPAIVMNQFRLRHDWRHHASPPSTGTGSQRLAAEHSKITHVSRSVFLARFWPLLQNIFSSALLLITNNSRATRDTWYGQGKPSYWDSFLHFFALSPS